MVNTTGLQIFRKINMGGKFQEIYYYYGAWDHYGSQWEHAPTAPVHCKQPGYEPIAISDKQLCKPQTESHARIKNQKHQFLVMPNYHNIKTRIWR